MKEEFSGSLLRCVKPSTHPLLRVYIFPFAGALETSIALRGWLCSAMICEVHIAVTSDEHDDVLVLSKQLASEIKALQSNGRTVPYIFVGMSLGCLLAFETTRFLSISHFPLPQHTFLIASAAPQTLTKSRRIHLQSDEDFLNTLRSFGLVDSASLQDSEFRDIFLPKIRKDIRLHDLYEFSNLDEPLGSKLFLFGGENDHFASVESISDWEDLYTSWGSSNIEIIAGLGHEFIVKKAEYLRETICKTAFSELITTPIPNILKNKAQHTPNITAVSFENDRGTIKHISFGVFVHTATALACCLQEEFDVQQGDYVLLIAEATFSTFLSMMALSLLGAIYVPCDPKMTSEDARNRMDILTPKFILLCSPTDSLSGLSVPCPYMRIEGLGFQKYLGKSLKPVKLSLKDECLVAHTSGSTGLPKAVAIHHGNILNNHLWRSFKFPMNNNEDCYGISIFWFWYWMLPLMNGYRIAPLPSSDMLHVDPYLRMMKRLNVTHIEVSPTYCNLLADHDSEIKALRSISLLILMGEVIYVSTVKKLQQATPRSRIVNIYSLTETNDITQINLDKRFLETLLSKYPSVNAAPIGEPAWNVNISMLSDNENQMMSLSEAPVDTPCQMVVERAPIQVMGYVKNPKANGKSFLTSGGGVEYFRLNDLATILQKDPMILVVNGRADRVVNVRGKRVGLDRVTGILKSSTGVIDCVVLWNEDLQQLVAFVVLSTDVESLRKEISNALTGPETPSRFILLDEMPLNSQSKIDLQALKHLLDSPPAMSQLSNSLFQAPSSSEVQAIQSKVLEIWSRVLGTSDVSENDDFTKIGGHSLLVVQMLKIVNESFGRDISIADFYNGYTILRDFAVLVANDTHAVQMTDFSYPLSPDIVPPGAQQFFVQISCIFFTGSTGFVGAFLLHGLLKQYPDAKIICLVRMKSDLHPEQRLRRNLQRYNLWENAFEDQLEVVQGDLSEDSFGFSESQFREIGSRAELIVHCGKQVNLAKAAKSLLDSNVKSTETCVRLACQGKHVSHVCYISTLGVFQPLLQGLSEYSEIGPPEKLPNGYSKTSVMAEKVISQAQDRGIPVMILRLGQMFPSTEDAVWNPNDFWYFFFGACNALNSYPRLHQGASMEFTPVNYAVAMMLHLIGSRVIWLSGRTTFHIVNKEEIPYSKLLDFLGNISVHPWQTWVQKLRENLKTESVIMLSAMVTEELEENEIYGYQTFGCEETLATLKEIGFTVEPPVINDGLLSKWLDAVEAPVQLQIRLSDVVRLPDDLGLGIVAYSSPSIIGVQLDTPIGNSNGDFLGKRYFETLTNHAVFHKPGEVSKIDPEMLLHKLNTLYHQSESMKRDLQNRRELANNQSLINYETLKEIGRLWGEGNHEGYRHMTDPDIWFDYGSTTVPELKDVFLKFTGWEGWLKWNKDCEKAIEWLSFEQENFSVTNNVIYYTALAKIRVNGGSPIDIEWVYRCHFDDDGKWCGEKLFADIPQIEAFFHKRGDQRGGPRRGRAA